MGMIAGNTFGLMMGSPVARDTIEGFPPVKSVAGEMATTADGSGRLRSLAFKRVREDEIPPGRIPHQVCGGDRPFTVRTVFPHREYIESDMQIYSSVP